MSFRLCCRSYYRRYVSNITLFILYTIITSFFTLSDVFSYRKSYIYANQKYLFEILDTAGQEEFSAMRNAYVRPSTVNALIYSICDRSSFDDIPDLMKRLSHTLNIASDEYPRVILVGNKCDLASSGGAVNNQRKVTFAEGLQLARKYGCPFLETRCVYYAKYAQVYACEMHESLL